MRSSTKPCLALLLGVVTFLVYGPSLKSDFVYDARLEILQSTFIHSLSNLPFLLSLRVLGTHLTLGSRPGQLLFMMINAAVWGKNPFGYHLSSILLHVANVVLLFLLLLRLAREKSAPPGDRLKVQIACATATMVFALHPIAVESVAEVSYSSALLVTFFTLATLYAATAFRTGPKADWQTMTAGGVCVFSALAAVLSKESGIAAFLVLISYWLLFRRKGSQIGWLVVAGIALALIIAFLTARFLLAPIDPHAPGYIGGSLSGVCMAQPRLWVFMMGKLFWPMQLSADYMPENLPSISAPAAWGLLLIVLTLQGALTLRSPIGALGVAIYWSGLVAVSNFVPLYRPLADRFYYLPLAGCAMQLLALLLLALHSKYRFIFLVSAILCAVLPLTLLTRSRENVFANSRALWSDTLQASPTSITAADNLGFVLFEQADYPAALTAFNRALQLAHGTCADAWMGAAMAYDALGLKDQAVSAMKKAVQLDPIYADPIKLERTVPFEPVDDPPYRAVLKEAGFPVNDTAKKSP